VPSLDAAAGVELIRAGARDAISSPSGLPVAIERHVRDLRERAGSRRALLEEIGHELNSPLAALVLGLELIGEEIAALGHHQDVPQPLDRTRAREIESLVADAARAGDRLCAVVAELRERQHVASAPVDSNRRGRILIVDDEPALARALCRILGDHEITVANDGQDALSYIANGDRFDVILCDLIMPNMTGMELHEALLRTAPEQTSKVAFMTGGAHTPRAREFLEQIANPRLDKPFEAAQVRSLVASLLAR
jgi:CheY-like chemotaxis protein